MVPINLQEIAAAAADLFLATGNDAAAQAAGLMKQASPQEAADEPRELTVLAHLREVALPPAFGDSASRLPWTDDGFALPAAIRGRNAYAELIGSEGPLLSRHCRFGFYLQAPECLYPAHSHAAEELYLILSGAPEWRVDGAERFFPPVLGLIHHLPWQRHEMRTGPHPLLAMWVWLGDIRYLTYSI